MSNLGIARPGPVVKAIQDSVASDRVRERFWFWCYCSSGSILGVEDKWVCPTTMYFSVLPGNQAH